MFHGFAGLGEVQSPFQWTEHRKGMLLSRRDTDSHWTGGRNIDELSASTRSRSSKQWPAAPRW